MTQQNSTTNWVIQGSNGQPQMIKLVQSSGKPISGIVTTSTVAGQPMKIYKTSVPAAAAATVVNNAGNVDSASQSFSAAQVLRSIGSSPKIITRSVPLTTLPKGPTKTIRLKNLPQMQNIKLVTAGTIRQLQTSTSSVPVSHSTASMSSASASSTMSPTVTSSNQSKIISPPVPPILSRKRQDPLEVDCVPETKRQRKSEKLGKGLRHFSMKVCEKVKQKGTTSYNEVADELVGEFTNTSNMNGTLAEQYDQKNIRRRVYDALNVLMAMNIISKEKKEIKWIGLPTNSWQECMQLKNEIKKREESIREKRNQLRELVMNLIAFKNLANRNSEMELLHGAPQPNSYIQLPFIVVNTNKKTVINCSISNDKMEYLFQFSNKFEINDDVEILKSIGMLKGLDTGDCSQEDLQKIKKLVPESLWTYVDEIASGKSNDLAGTSSMMDEYLDPTADEENSHQSGSFDALSPGGGDYSDDENESDMSSDTEVN